MLFRFVIVLEALTEKTGRCLFAIYCELTSYVSFEDFWDLVLTSSDGYVTIPLISWETAFRFDQPSYCVRSANIT